LGFLLAKVHSAGEPNTMRQQELHVLPANTVARQGYPSITDIFPPANACAPAVAKKVAPVVAYFLVVLVEEFCYFSET
jgi:hypothetical protein